jgi:hypothetical protein
MINKIKSQIKKYFNNENIIFEEVKQWRTNLNFFIKNWEEEYFVRTSILKVQDILFWGLLEKEKQILEILGQKEISPKLIYSEISKNYWFLIIEKIENKKYENFNKDLDKIKILLEEFQKINISNFENLKTFSLKEWYKKIILDRFSKINVSELKEINNNLIDFLFNNEYNFKDDFCLTHNDFRLDNLIITEKKVFLIDVEWMSISDKYLDLWEYYVWWIFWDTFPDKKEFNFTEFSNLMNNFWYKNKEKQKFIFILKFCSNFSWLSSYISENKNPEKIYVETLEKNKKNYYKFIEKLIK